MLRKRGQLIDIKYETLLEQPKTVMMSIYKFLDEQYHQDKLRVTIDSVNKSNCYKWENKMKPKDIELFETVASNTLKHFGYATSFSGYEVGEIEKYFWKIHNSMYRFRNLIKMNTVDAIRIKYFGKEPFAD